MVIVIRKSLNFPPGQLHSQDGNIGGGVGVERRVEPEAIGCPQTFECKKTLFFKDTFAIAYRSDDVTKSIFRIFEF